VSYSHRKLLNGTVQKVGHDESLFATVSTSNFYRVKQDIDAPLNAAWIRIAVHDMGTGRSGVMEIPLPLPAESQAGSPTAGAPASASSSRAN
jgi:hypothetical protein